MTFTGKVTLNSSAQGQDNLIKGTPADSCNGDEFMPSYCRRAGGNENNNSSAPISLSLPKVLYDFVVNANSANWSNDLDQILPFPAPSQANDARGYALWWINSQVLEDGSKPGLVLENYRQMATEWSNHWKVGKSGKYCCREGGSLCSSGGVSFWRRRCLPFLR